MVASRSSGGRAEAGVRPAGSRRPSVARSARVAMDVTKPAPPRVPPVDTHAVRIELDTDRKIRARNKVYYRFNHWPIWIFVFFIAPGPLTFDLFERGFDQWTLGWLALVLVGTGFAGLFGQLPGCEPRPYIIRRSEERRVGK